VDYSWWDPTAAWWAKAQRADKHIADISAMVAAFNAAKAYEVGREATDDPIWIAFRLHVLTPPPVELLTTIGDALHNLRSSLDSVAYELARRHVAEPMTERQQKAVQFPIRSPRDGIISQRFPKPGVIVDSAREPVPLVARQPFGSKRTRKAPATPRP
jgi:hypothetical protein